CVVHQHVDSTERVNRGLHDGLPAFRGGDAVVVGRRAATETGDLVDDALSRGRRGATAVECAAEVVDQHVRAPTSEFEGVRPAETATGSGDDGYPSVKAQLGHRQVFLRRGLAVPAVAGRREVLVEASAGMGLRVIERDGERTKVVSTARSACFWPSSSRESWRIASSVRIECSAVVGESTPAAWSRSVSVETLSASARAVMTAIEGSTTPCSIWLR